MSLAEFDRQRKMILRLNYVAMSIKSDQWIRHMAREHGMVEPVAVMTAQSERLQERLTRQQAWTCISDGAPETGGGGASASITADGGTTVAAASDDDDGGDPDPEPARRRPKESAIAHDSGETLLRLRGVQARVPLSKSAIYKLISEKKFPEPIRLSARCSLWRASDVDAFVSSLA